MICFPIDMFLFAVSCPIISVCFKGSIHLVEGLQRSSSTLMIRMAEGSFYLHRTLPTMQNTKWCKPSAIFPCGCVWKIGACSRVPSLPCIVFSNCSLISPFLVVYELVKQPAMSNWLVLEPTQLKHIEY